MTPISTERIKDGLKSLIGKNFLYHTKYNGKVFGTIVDVGITHTMAFDPATENSIRKFIDMKECRPASETEETLALCEPGPSWAGIKVEPFVISEADISYSLDEIYILTKYEE